MLCWGELKSLRAQSVGEDIVYWSCVQFSRYVEMKVSQTYSSSELKFTSYSKPKLPVLTVNLLITVVTKILVNLNVLMFSYLPKGKSF